MTSHTSCVLPMLRVCPPTTITRHFGTPLTSLPFQLGFQLFNACRQFGKTCLPGELLFEFFERARWCSPNGLTGPNCFPAKHSCLSSDHGAILQIALLSEPGLTAHNNVLAKFAGAGQARLGRHDGGCANLAVVGDLHQL